VPAIGAYLSGGFDSSVVASLVQSFYPGRLKTYSIGFQDSPDLLAARKVAAMIGSEHHEYVVTEEQALRMLPDVIRQVETMDVTTIRASTFMLMLSYYIRDNSDIAVVFSGEGSDEMGSYAYFKRAPDEASFQQEACRLLQELPFYDAQRADRCSAAAGLELRVPFLDKELVQYYMQIPPALRTQRGFEKYLLRKACSDLYGPALLPEEILWRPKEAMSDGVSQLGRSWSTIIQENIMSQRYVGDGVAGFRSIALPGPMESPVMAERSAFRDMFLQYYPGCQHLLRHYWLPSWCGDVQDPSARVLEVYDRKAALM
jgi:asparagine synthase (glutamine-hydrolysing)